MAYDWPSHRHVIVKLYNEQPLRVVMQTMKAEYDFAPSERAYRQKIKEWRAFKQGNKIRDSTPPDTDGPRGSYLAADTDQAEKVVHQHPATASFEELMPTSNHLIAPFDPFSTISVAVHPTYLPEVPVVPSQDTEKKRRSKKRE